MVSRGGIVTWENLLPQEERIEWMEALKPGSSECLRNFTMRSTLHKLHYDPYSLVGQDPSVGAMTPMSELNSPFPALGQQRPRAQPSNYIKPVPSTKRRIDTDHYSQAPYVGGQGEFVCGNPCIKPPTRPSESVDGRHMLNRACDHLLFPHNGQTPVVGVQAGGRSDCVHENPRIKPTRLFEGGRINQARDRQLHSPHSSFTERTESPEHLYEIEIDNMMSQSVAPLQPPLPSRAPPTAKPGKKQCPPQRTLSDSQSVSSPGECLSPEEEEPRYSYGPAGAPEPAVRKLPKPTAQLPKAVTKPTIAPRKMVDKKPEGNYLCLVRGDESGSFGTNSARYDDTCTPHRKPANDYLCLRGDGTSDSTDSVRYDDIPHSPPSKNVPSLPGSTVQSFTSNQLDLLVRMLQQVQSGDGPQDDARTAIPRCEGSGVSKGQFGQCYAT